MLNNDNSLKTANLIYLHSIYITKLSGIYEAAETPAIQYAYLDSSINEINLSFYVRN